MQEKGLAIQTIMTCHYLVTNNLHPFFFIYDFVVVVLVSTTTTSH